MAGQRAGKVTIDVEECKGCGLCVESCPPKCLELAPELNAYGVHPAHYTGEDCTGCGICFYCCPEPGAITVYRLGQRLPPKQTAGAKHTEAPMRQLCKGNVAVVKGAILAGCRAYYGYPITPASEIAEAPHSIFRKSAEPFCRRKAKSPRSTWCMARRPPGVRVMTASSGPGLSLMQEGMSYLAGAELPCVIVDMMRGGPGLGNIAPEQSDYFAMVKGGGHGNYRNLVLAPASVQEMADLTMLAFDLADKYRNPAMVLADGFIGQMMEPLDLEYREIHPPEKAWAVKGTPETRANLVSSIYLEPTTGRAQREMEAKYIRAQKPSRGCELF
jgi:pyruvate/2-oxoacid:ferredoxin oxidoreductase alpha subunit/NAD-dependent dihydropyrimidine dehydrogenase PreA subunit